MAEQKGSKIIICSDPQGESIVLYEQKRDNSWRQVSFEQIVILMMQTLKPKN